MISLGWRRLPAPGEAGEAQSSPTWGSLPGGERAKQGRRALREDQLAPLQVSQT